MCLLLRKPSTWPWHTCGRLPRELALHVSLQCPFPVLPGLGSCLEARGDYLRLSNEWSLAQHPDLLCLPLPVQQGRRGQVSTPMTSVWVKEGGCPCLAWGQWQCASHLLTPTPSSKRSYGAGSTSRPGFGLELPARLSEPTASGGCVAAQDLGGLAHQASALPGPSPASGRVVGVSLLAAWQARTESGLLVSPHHGIAGI